MMKKLACLLLLGLGCLPAYALDAQDQGDYVILHSQTQQPTGMQMRFYLQGRQWMMDGRQLPEARWEPVCRGTGECRLAAASASDVAQWKATLPASWQAHRFSCIKNQALGFCHVEDRNHPGRRAYWMFALVNGYPQAMMVNRLR
ncbi:MULTISPECIES: hypothetical protein [Eikenella]|nr:MULTISPECIES: hypothetical protein [Eikenella]